MAVQYYRWPRTWSSVYAVSDRTRGVLLVFFLVAWELAWEGLGAQTAPRLTGTHRDGVRGGSSHK